ncbi:MAG TPA: lipoxygenase family protein [Gaiellaceae bacterium]|nr:lipoxygenase family protein [Gaiellaceae bacterium]
MAWKIFKWVEHEFVELGEKLAELGAEDVSRAAPRTDTSFLRKLPTREWGLEHCPALPYWADEHGDPDLKHVLAQIVKLGVRGQEGVSTAYHGLSNDYTIDGQTRDAYEFLYDLPRPGSKDKHPQGTPRPDRLTLQSPSDFTMSWTTYENVDDDSKDLGEKFAATLTDPATATELFWPTISNFGIGYNLLVLDKPDTKRAAQLERDFGAAWHKEGMASLLDEGLLYEIDMSVLDEVGGFTALDGAVRFTPATVTVLKQDKDSKELTPIAIRAWTKGGASHVYTGGDNAWLYALQAAKASITVWGIWLGHVYHWHIVTAAMQMAMFNTLPAGHKLYPLLEPQSQSLIDFDFTLMTHLWGQISPPTPVSSYVGLATLLDRFAAEGGGRSFFDDDPMVELAKRRLDAKDFTKVTPWDAYPVVGFLLDIWEITGDYVTAVVHEIYKTNDEVANDHDLHDWMKTAGHPDHGNVRGLPETISTRDELAKILTSILYRVTVHGAGSMNPAVNPVLSFVSNYPPCLQRDDIPHPDEDVRSTLLEYLPHTGTIGGMTTFYYTFVYSQPYTPLIPSGGVEADPYFPKSQPGCNQALFAYRTAISAFAGEYLIAWNKALDEIRGTAGAPPKYAENQAGQWPSSIEI